VVEKFLLLRSDLAGDDSRRLGGEGERVAIGSRSVDEFANSSRELESSMLCRGSDECRIFARVGTLRA
jgi:hypothetical protein